jgi:hypothetical protein
MTTHKTVEKKETIEIPTSVSDEEELQKREDSGRGSTASDFVSQTSRASADLAAGVAKAVGSGLEAYSKSLTGDNVLQFSTENGFFEGTLRGYAALFDELGSTARRVLSDVQDRRRQQLTSERQVVIVMDYEKLAKLVAVELSKDSTGARAAK